MRVLVVAPAPPWPPRRGYQLRAAQLVEALSPSHSVSVIAQQPAGFAAGPAPPDVDLRLVPMSHRSRIQALVTGIARWPGQVAQHAHAPLQRAITGALEHDRPDVAIVVLSRLGTVLPALDGVPVVVDLIDDLVGNMRARARCQRPWARAAWRWEARRLEAWERRLLSRVDGAWLVAERDRDAVASTHPAAALHVVPLAMPFASATPLDGASTVLLSGNIGYFPTRHGARWFADRVWPRVRDKHPEARWCIAGSRIPTSLGALDGRDGVEVVADPADLDAIRRRATVAIAPLFAGSGTPIKVLEAMSVGVPVVATPAAAAGLDAVPADAIRITDDAAGFADAVAHLLDDRSAGRQQAAAARSWLADRHAPSNVSEAIAAALAAL